VKRAAGFIAALLFGSSMVEALPLSPRDFAFGLPVITTQEAAAYRFSLPLSVYQDSVRKDLGDIRLFNAGGVAVPFSLLRPARQASIHKPAIALPVFPLREGSRVVIDGIHVTIDSPRSAINLQTQNGGGGDLSANQYILDGRALDSGVSALRMSWPEAASDYSGRVSVEASDDLGSWRTVVAAAPIANLHANGRMLIENRIILAPTAAKYWRIKWLGAPPAFEITSVLAEPAESLAAPLRATLEVEGKPDPVNANDYLFDLGAHAPVSRVNVVLPEVNTTVAVELSSRPAANEPWRIVARGGFYRLKAADAEQLNAPLEVRVDDDRYWRARITDSAGPPRATLRLHVEWIPNEVTFLAQGQGPFLLAYGNATAIRAEADLSQMPATLQISPATVGSRQVLGGPTRLVGNPAAFPWMRALLWGVLLMAVALLAWMAHRLANEPGR
jgi:Protein of unknown function (DUF3999)